MGSRRVPTNTTRNTRAYRRSSLAELSALRLVTDPLQPTSFATGGTKSKTAQGKPRHATRSDFTQQQQPKRMTLSYGLPGTTYSCITWSWPKASSSILALALLCSVLPQTNASASLVQSTGTNLESDSDARSAERDLFEPLSHHPFFSTRPHALCAAPSSPLPPS